MAPISDKRQRNDQSPLKEKVVPSYGQIRIHNVTHNANYGAHTKENNIAANVGIGGKHMKRGLEILDFHESWLEEMEIYKDQLNQHQQSHKRHYGNYLQKGDIEHLQSNHHDIHNLQQLFLRTQQQHQNNVANSHLSESHKIHSQYYNATNTAGGQYNNNNEQNSVVVTSPISENNERLLSRKSSPRRNRPSSAGPKRRSPEVQLPKTLTKNYLRNVPTVALSYGNSSLTDNKFITLPAMDLLKSQSLLKRTREETNMTVSTTNKTVPATVNLSTNPITTTTTTTTTNTTTTTSSNHINNNNNNHINNNSSSNNSQGTKRHVRDNHAVTASGSLNADNNNVTTSTITNNSNTNNNNNNNNNNNASGIVNGAKIIVNQFHASSLLNSFHYEEKTKILTQNGLNKSAANAYEASFYANNYLTTSADQNPSPYYGTRPYSDYNYSGVSLANGDHARKRGGHSDDPCGAIDEVTYTDSESESEEYVGLPLHLKEDGADTCQSRNIRHGPFFEDNKSEKKSTTNLNADKTNPTADNEDTSTIKSEQSVYYTPLCILTPSLFPNVPPYLNFSSHAEKGPTMPVTLHKVLKWKLSPVMPRIVKRVVLNSGFRIIKNTTDWMAVWEKHMKSPGFRTIRSHQKYNHMPGSFRIGRKDSMWRCIHHNMQKHGNKEFGFMQKSYIMPDDLEALRTSWPRNASKLTKWIVKPPASARGTGIRIINKWSQFPKDRPLVVQKYIERPLLINDNKFDMRIYVVVTSINPLRIYMYKDGLARFASVKYSSELNHLDDRCMHLTNYSINKLSQNYSKNEDVNACQGHKWSLQSLWSCLEARGINTKRLWATLRNLVIRAIVSGESGLNRMYRQNVNFRYNCFELFGFDVLLDENLIPWLLEINISPSLHSELPLDLHVKGPLIQATLNTALYQVPPKLNDKQQHEIMSELNIKKGPLCLDKRIYTTCLTSEEVRKHNHFTNRNIEFREEYLESILESLLPDDVRCLIVAEDELARCSPMERIFPTADTYNYLKFMENSRYYNRLLDAWENRYAHCRDVGIDLLRGLCAVKYHLQVADAALEREPQITLTDIDMLHTRKADGDVVTLQDDNYATGVQNVPNTSQLPTVETVVAAVSKSDALASLKVKESTVTHKEAPKAVKAN